jgi:hypothetical protein
MERNIGLNEQESRSIKNKLTNLSKYIIYYIIQFRIILIQ